ncbi:DUF485 domain-containing protein [Caballeronia sp. LZ001]|uniref:DUF485 domain-containing protein n=1 Tax=Caballeronia sp. LZ001 TaxID=3038553 RepID=UPI00286A72F6|nr:DUF485 domain-containing protein [Caballeronia sp. LZ001]
MDHSAPTYAMNAHVIAEDPPPPMANPLLDDPRFQALVQKRRAFSWMLTLLMLTVYFAFILTLAFAPALLGRPIVAGYPATWGIPVGFGMFVFTFGIVAVYVARANTFHDRAVNEIRQGARQ